MSSCEVWVDGWVVRYEWMGSCGDEGEGFVQVKKIKFAS